MLKEVDEVIYVPPTNERTSSRASFLALMIHVRYDKEKCAEEK